MNTSKYCRPASVERPEPWPKHADRACSGLGTGRGREPSRDLSARCARTRARFGRVLLFAAAVLCAAPVVASPAERLVVLPFEITDNTPMPGAEERNRLRLEQLTRYVARSIEEAGIYDTVPQEQVERTVSEARLGTAIHDCNQCEIDLAQAIDGDKVMTGWIYKMSILILTLHIEIKDVASQRTLLSKAYDFRGDNDKAWRRAADYMVRDLNRMLKP